MNANQRLIYRHKIPQKNITILALSLVAIVVAMWFTGGENSLQLLTTIVPVMGGALVLALLLSRYINRHSISELAFENDQVLARQWGLAGNGPIIRFAKNAATDWTLVEKRGITLYITFRVDGTEHQMPLYNAQFMDWNGLAEIAPDVVEAVRKKHGKKPA